MLRKKAKKKKILRLIFTLKVFEDVANITEVPTE